MTPLENDPNCTPMKNISASTPSKHNTTTITPSYNGLGSGYVKPNMMCPNAQGYVQHSTMLKPRVFLILFEF